MAADPHHGAVVNHLDRYLTTPTITFCDCGHPNEDHDSDPDCAAHGKVVGR